MRLIGLMALLLVTACGQKFCFGPFGSFDDCFPQTTTTAGNGYTGLYIEVPSTSAGLMLATGTSLTLTARNGTSPYYWKVMTTAGSGVGTLTGTAYGTSTTIFTGPTIQYNAPATAVAGVATVVLLYDSNGGEWYSSFLSY